MNRSTAWFVGLCLAVYTFENSLGNTGVLVQKKSSDVDWQWLTMYKFGSGSGWSRDGITGSYVVCDIESTLTNHTNSWMVSDFIQSDGANEVVTSLTFTTRECPPTYPHCVQYLYVFALFTDQLLDGGVKMEAITEGNFTLVGNITASVTWKGGVTPQDNVANLTFTLPKKNLYLAFKDIGSCTAIKKVSVTYKYCPTVTTNGVTYNRTFVPALRDVDQSVSGKCSSNASSRVSHASFLAKCLASGDWTVNSSIGCFCNAGFEVLNQICQGCPSGKFKGTIGNQACTACPGHAHPSIARDQCSCDSGYTRAASEPANNPCSAPPSAPVDLRTTTTSLGVSIVIWLPPINNGGRDDVTYDVTCKKCLAGICNAISNDVSFWPANQGLVWTYVTIVGLAPMTTYRVTVMAKNGVSGEVSYHSNASVVFTVPETIASSTTNSSTVTPAKQTSDNTSNEVATAIGVSVASTFIVCLVIGVIVVYMVIRKHRNKTRTTPGQYEPQRNDSVMTSMSELCSSITRHREPDSLRSSITGHREPNSASREKKQGDLPEVKTELPPALNNTWIDTITRNQNQNSSLDIQDEFGSTVYVKSWFPQEKVQYGI